MISQSFLLLKIQLLKGFGINETIHCRDARKKRRLILLLSVYILLGIMLVFYTAGAAFMLCAAGAADSVPGFVVAVSSLAIFVFTLFKAGPVLFAAGDYDMLTALPVRPFSIIVSRLLHMYVSSLMLSLLTMIPSCLLYGWMAAPVLLAVLPLPEVLGLWDGSFFTAYPLTLEGLDPAFTLPGPMVMAQLLLLAAGAVLLALGERSGAAKQKSSW